MDVLACATTHPRSPRRRCDHPRLSVVIVNYRHWDDTARLVRQLRTSAALARGDAEIVVVDNHSPPHRLMSRLRRLDGVSLRRWKSNRGFARAVNEGCRLSRGEWLLLLNPDTSVAAEFLDDVLDRVERLDPRAGIVGFRLFHDDGTWQLSTGRFPGLGSTLARLALPRPRRKYTPPERDGLCEVDWVTGCGLLIRRECLTELGGLDPEFFLYYEDVDLCRRARQGGWTVWFDPSAGLVHHRPLHTRAVPQHLRLITRHALLTYARKHWPGWQQVLLSGIVGIEAQVRRGLARCRGDREAERTFAQLGELVREIRTGQPEAARARLMHVVRRQEQHLETAIVDRHSVSQSARSAPAVSGEHP